ncbi:MAG: DUF1800 domain-containing protein [Gemmatimonadaceae bacterium]
MTDDQGSGDEPFPPSAARTRRGFLEMGAGALAASAMLSSRAAAQKPTRRASLTTVIDRLVQRTDWRSVELKLVRRATLGMTEAEVARVTSIGFERYLEEQLNPDAIDDSAIETQIRTRYPQFYYSQAQLLAKDAVFWQEVAGPFARAVMEHTIFSRRQLKERMTEFWSDHFNILMMATRVVDYRDVVQQHAMGKFGDLVRASMRSPAMLMYLDQVWSTKFGVNENYARELMELHTVGWDGGYTQEDVHDLARLLTGWSMDSNRNFQYRAGIHDFGAKTVMGMIFAARPESGGTAGMDEGIAFAEHLIRHPATARFISTKLLKWFIRPDPTPAQIAAVVATYNATDGDIKAMLRTILTPANLNGAPPKLKRPFHYYVSVMRATGASVAAWNNWPQGEGLAGTVASMAHPLFSWPTPDGYPDRPEYWAGLMVNRWNAVSSILLDWGAVGQYPRFTAATFMPTATVPGVLGEINRRMFGGELSLGLRAELQNWLQTGQLTQTRVRDAVYLAACSPEFQYY